ncbi:MAG TPA: cysteate synthase [Ktedonosporobacter sp.]|jgi:cysteate synthase|nr:cysteate synthase [Ktedonosporobacter sp.]
MSRRYKLVCQTCNKEFEDNGFLLECDGGHEATLLTTHYTIRQFKVDSLNAGLYRYQHWLPIQHTLPEAGKTVIYQSERLSNLTGLPLLWIAFNGYWPEREASLETATFKELEAYAVLSRLPARYDGILVVSSAGNTAAAFASLCSRTRSPCLIIMPERGLVRMKFPETLNPCVKIVSLVGFVDYYDAITLANKVAAMDGFLLEGGVKNVGRRDGLGTTLLSAVEEIGQLPNYYFQAVGSGAGGIAVHEAAQRLVQDGRFGLNYPRLMLSQNLPFTPMYHSWKAGQRDLMVADRDESKKQIGQVVAQVLSNQYPPYSIKGGVYDALKESRGDMLAANNDEAQRAMKIFQESEGIDIDPAAGVAFATLLDECARGHINRNALVLLNITGGGWQRRCADYSLKQVQPSLEINAYELSLEQTIEKIRRLFP